MAEYIFRSENNSNFTDGMADMCALLPDDWYGTLHEKIVRCHDCFRQANCPFIYEYGYYQNGFCAWGERRDA